jgi:hypothetical protein
MVPLAVVASHRCSQLIYLVTVAGGRPLPDPLTSLRSVLSQITQWRDTSCAAISPALRFP